MALSKLCSLKGEATEQGYDMIEVRGTQSGGTEIVMERRMGGRIAPKTMTLDNSFETVEMAALRDLAGDGWDTRFYDNKVRAYKWR